MSMRHDLLNFLTGRVRPCMYACVRFRHLKSQNPGVGSGLGAQQYIEALSWQPFSDTWYDGFSFAASKFEVSLMDEWH